MEAGPHGLIVLFLLAVCYKTPSANSAEHDVFCDDARDTKLFRMPCDEVEALAYPGEPLSKRTGSPPPPLPPMMAGAGSAGCRGATPKANQVAWARTP